MCLCPLALLVHRQLPETSWLEPCEMNSLFCRYYSLAHSFWELIAGLRRLLVAAMCAGTSVKDSILVELSFLLLPFCCHLPPAQVLLKEIKCWTCCFEALRFLWNKWLLAAASCLTCPVSNQGHGHWLHQRCGQRPSLTVPEKIEIETTLSWSLLESGILANDIHRNTKLGHMPLPIQRPLPLLHDARENHATQHFLLAACQQCANSVSFLHQHGFQDSR